MRLHAQKKGKAGEVELCAWLDENLRLPELRAFGKKTERQYNQADGHSTDIIIEDFIIEVKRREILDLQSWWHQVMVAKKNHPDENLIPVVAFRQNRKRWEFLLPANLIGLDKGFIRLTERTFITFANNLIWDKES